MKQNYWYPHKDEDEYEDATLHLFFEILAASLLTSKHLVLDRTILARAWNLQVASQSGARNKKRSPLSLKKEFYVYVLMDPQKPGIYEYEILGKVVRFTHEPFYIGKGRGNRITHHARNILGSSRKDNKIRKLRQQGLQPIEKKLSCNLIEAVAFVKEQLLISTLGRLDLGMGPLTNGTDGGEGSTGSIHSAGTRAKRSCSLTGKRKTQEHRANISLARKGKKFSKEHCENISAAKIGSTHTFRTSSHLGRCSKQRWKDPEYRAKIIASQTRAQQDPTQRASQSARSKALWQDPEYRERQMAARRRSVA